MGKFSLGIPATALFLLADISSGTEKKLMLKGGVSLNNVSPSSSEVSIPPTSESDDRPSQIKKGQRKNSQQKREKYCWRVFTIVAVLLVMAAALLCGITFGGDWGTTPSCNDCTDFRIAPERKLEDMRTFVSDRKEECKEGRMWYKVEFLMLKYLTALATPGGLEAEERRRLNRCTDHNILREQTEMKEAIKKHFCLLKCNKKRPKWAWEMIDVPAWDEPIEDWVVRSRRVVEKFYWIIEGRIRKIKKGSDFCGEEEASKIRHLLAVKRKAPFFLADEILEGYEGNQTVPTKEELVKELTPKNHIGEVTEECGTPTTTATTDHGAVTREGSTPTTTETTDGAVTREGSTPTTAETTDHGAVTEEGGTRSAGG